MKELYYELTINQWQDIKHLYQKDKFKQIAQIQTNMENISFCYRCGNKKLIYFNNQIYCKNCLEFGKVQQGFYFYQKQMQNHEFKYADRLAEITFAKRQLLAAKFIFSTLMLRTDCLIHAVCGAGKTEITFQAIAYYLQQHKYICFAIPRIDILYEIYERLAYYFPLTKICLLNSQEEKIQHGQLYLMTTNQIIKFKQVFSLIIVDEIDAFPFEYNLKYDYGVQQAKTPTGSIVYLTSTPSVKFLAKKLPIYIINRRWHEYKLPVPRFKYFKITTFLKFGNQQFINKLKSYNECPKQVIIFISNIKLGYQIKTKLEQNNLKLKFVYANSQTRLADIQAFKAERFNILLTTTVLERGVTFKNVDVIVLDAHSKMYNKASLIQIAGRVGRKKEYQTGKVYFYSEDFTITMQEAKKEIEKFNI